MLLYYLGSGSTSQEIVLGRVDNRGFNGDISLNPYIFQHYNFFLRFSWTDNRIRGPRFSHHFPDRVLYVPSTPNLLEGTEYLATLGTQLDENSLSTDTPCTVLI